MPTLDIETSLKALRGFDIARQQGNRVVLWQHNRWHYITLEYDLSEIVAVNFMNEAQIKNSLATMANNANFVKFSDVTPNFVDELAEKVLSVAEAYRPLLANGRCHLVIGHTTDTLRTLEADIDTLVETIQQRMDGKPGAYISFR